MIGSTAKSALLSPTVCLLGRFGGLLPILIGFLLTVIATMGPSLISSPSFCLMKIGGLPGHASDHAYFGTWASCYKIAGGSLKCSKSSVNPNYDWTLDVLNQNGLPELFTRRLVHHLVQTPQAQIVAFVFLFLSMLLAVPALLAAWIPNYRLSPSRWLPPTRSKALFWISTFFLFWGFLIGLTASLAQRDQFNQAAQTFNTVVAIRLSDLPNLGLGHAELGSAFGQQWAATTFLGLAILYQTVVYLQWPEEDVSGYWKSAPSPRLWSPKA